jgi:SOS-response transcriptional repressor LexA/DNA-binding XRE family transcriptional regulator
MQPRSADAPEWARKIVSLRERLGLSQAALGARLHYSAMAVSRWERGKKEPPAQCWIQLGNLAGDPECWLFWSRAGLRSADVSRMLPEGRGTLGKARLPEFEIVLAGSGKKSRKVRKAPSKLKLVAIPLLPIHAATRGETGHPNADLGDVAAEGMVAAPEMWCPNPPDTSCLRVKGSSMSPSIIEGDIVAVDSAQTDPGKLSSKLIVAWHRQHGLSLARFRQMNGVQMLESENRDYEPILLSKDRNWRIIGKVLWLIRQTA